MYSTDEETEFLPKSDFLNPFSFLLKYPNYFEREIWEYDFSVFQKISINLFVKTYETFFR